MIPDPGLPVEFSAHYQLGYLAAWVGVCRDEIPPGLRRAWERVQWCQRAEAVSRVVRDSYAAERRGGR